MAKTATKKSAKSAKAALKTKARAPVKAATSKSAAVKAARPDYHLSWASPGVISPDDKFGDSWPDYKAVAELIDAYTVMSYVMTPPTIGSTGSAQPLGGGVKIGSHARDYRTLVQDYLAATGGRSSSSA